MPLSLFLASCKSFLNTAFGGTFLVLFQQLGNQFIVILAAHFFEIIVGKAVIRLLPALLFLLSTFLMFLSKLFDIIYGFYFVIMPVFYDLFRITEGFVDLRINCLVACSQNYVARKLVFIYPLVDLFVLRFRKIFSSETQNLDNFGI